MIVFYNDLPVVSLTFEREVMAANPQKHIETFLVRITHIAVLVNQGDINLETKRQVLMRFKLPNNPARIELIDIKVFKKLSLI